jgi:broad specificity phosphatase PhoE
MAENDHCLSESVSISKLNMAKIITIRHAESIANTKGIYQGQSYDTFLSPLGVRQAQALAGSLKSTKVDRIISSPLKRTMQTAEEISDIINVRVETERRIIETNHGTWEGKNKEWIINNYSEAAKTWAVNPSQAVFPNGEKFEETIDRIRSYIFQKSWNGTTLLVTHDNIIRIMVCLAQSASMDDLWKVPIESAAVTGFKVVGINGQKKLKLISINDTSYLKELRSDISKHAL